MKKQKRRNFSPEFRLEVAQLVLDQGYTHEDAAQAMDVGISTVGKWAKQLREERQGQTSKAAPMTPEQIEIRALKKRIERIELENRHSAPLLRINFLIGMPHTINNNCVSILNI